MSSKLRTTEQGDLVVPSGSFGKFTIKDPESLRVMNLSDDLLVSAQLQPGQRKLPVLYGDMRLLNVGELMALISSMHKNGSLVLLVPHAQKTIYFSSGQIIYASSNVEDDRLGEVLWRRGYLDLKQLSEVHDLVVPGKRLGSVLIEQGMLTPRQLYDGIKEQVLEIVYSTFHFETGEFVFIESKVRVKGTVRLDMDTRSVIIEGIRRLAEMTKLEELFPDRDTVLIKRPVAMEAKLEEAERKLHGLVNGRLTVAQIIEQGRLGELESLKALAKLRRVGLIDVREQAIEEQREEGPLPDVLKEYTRLLRFIHQTLAVESPKNIGNRESYLGSPSPKHEKVFKNVGFDEDGKLDMDTLYRNARALDPEDAREVALDALRAFFDYAQFQTMDVLDDDACDRMMNKLHKIRSAMDE